MTTRLLLPAALLLCGCSLRHKIVAPEPARGPARDSLFLLDQTRGDSVAARGTIDGPLALLSPAVVFLRAGVPVVFGRDAARTLLAASPATGTYAWQPLGGGVSYDLRHAYTFGVAARAPGSTAIRLERYVAYWTRERGQPWRIAAYAEVNGSPAVEIILSAEQLSPPTAVPLLRPMADYVQSVRAADSLFSDLADRMGTGFAFANTATGDGVLFGPSQLVVGPKAIDDYFKAQPPGTSLSWRPVYAIVAASGDLAFTVGESIRTGRSASGAAEQRFGKYLTVWQRQRDGTWKFVVNGGNPTPAKAER
jgi:ketosteroid isomerase-like protein